VTQRRLGDHGERVDQPRPGAGHVPRRDHHGGRCLCHADWTGSDVVEQRGSVPVLGGSDT
jgi:hypothetical protein